MNEGLRPLERRMLALQHDGLGSEEIGRRFNRSPEFVDRVIAWTALPRVRGPRQHQGLRPIERRVVDLRANGMSYEEIARRFKKGVPHIRRVEQMAQMRTDLGLV